MRFVIRISSPKMFAKDLGALAQLMWSTPCVNHWEREARFLFFAQNFNSPGCVSTTTVSDAGPSPTSLKGRTFTW